MADLFGIVPKNLFVKFLSPDADSEAGSKWSDSLTRNFYEKCACGATPYIKCGRGKEFRNKTVQRSVLFSVL